MEVTKRFVNQLAYKIVGCAIEVHKELGPGLLESLYEECLIFELKNMGLKVTSQQQIVPIYKGIECISRLRFDILVEDLVLVENKSTNGFSPIDQAQLLSYMNLLEKPKGLLINYNVLNITTEGLIPLVNKYFAKLPE
ncbi:MAG: GxxExxY protein [Saprospiraceae bacterium]|nr:GxxExxY protein [Saprospiraceae bacterium]